MEALACRYSSSVSVCFNCMASAAHAPFSSSKAAGRPPHPTYRDKISCSSGVAERCSPSIFFRSKIASILARNFCFGPPAPRSSSVMRKLTGAGKFFRSSVSSASTISTLCSCTGSFGASCPEYSFKTSSGGSFFSTGAAFISIKSNKDSCTLSPICISSCMPFFFSGKIV